MDLAYSGLPRSVAVTILVPVVFVWLMRGLFADGWLAAWLGMAWCAALLRAMLWSCWSRTRFASARLRHKTIAFWTVTTLAALAWSAGAMILLAHSGSRETLMLAIMTFAIAAIGSSSLAAHLPSALTFVLVILVPVSLRLVASQDPVVRISGLAVVVGTAALAVTAFRAEREMANVILTELKLSAAAAEAASARAAAEEGSVAKSEFLANMSHELRTPLNAILGYSELLLEDARAQGSHQAAADLERVSSAGRHLLALITDVLDLSKIEAGRMELNLGTVDAAAAVRHVVDTSAPLAAASGNQLVVEGLDSLGTIEADAVKFQQVLLNLVGNACKFTSGGSVRISCRRERAVPSDWVVIEVHDTGIGMTPEQVARLFGYFMQADSSTTRRFGGTGLGLAISRRLCDLMGGAIGAESAFGKGSTFTVRVPALAPLASARNDRSGPAHGAAQSAA